MYSVDGPRVPAFTLPLLRRPNIDELVELPMEKAPSTLHVPNQRLRFVLRQQSDLPNTGVDAVGQREIDRAEVSAERYGGFGAPCRESRQAGAAASGKDERKRFGTRRPLTHRTSQIHCSPRLLFTNPLDLA